MADWYSLLPKLHSCMSVLSALLLLLCLGREIYDARLDPTQGMSHVCYLKLVKDWRLAAIHH